MAMVVLVAVDMVPLEVPSGTVITVAYVAGGGGGGNGTSDSEGGDAYSGLV